jgi:hypothetical protein
LLIDLEERRLSALNLAETLKELTATEEAKIAALVKKAAS